VGMEVLFQSFSDLWGQNLKAAIIEERKKGGEK